MGRRPEATRRRTAVMAEPTLYERLGGIFAIAAVIDNFSDRLLRNPKIVNANPELREWHTATYHTRMPGLKWGRTLWVAMKAGAIPVHRLGDARCALGPQDLTRGVRRSHSGTYQCRGRLQGARAGEGRGPGRLRCREGRGYGRFPAGGGQLAPLALSRA